MKEIIDHIKSRTESKIKILKYELVNDGAKLTSNLVFLLLLSLGIFLLTVLLSIVVLTGLSVYFDNYIIGSAITFVMFTIILGLFYAFFKDKIKESIMNKVYKEVIDENIDSSLKFEAIKEIEDLKVKYHESQAMNKAESIITNIDHSTNTITSLAHLLKNK